MITNFTECQRSLELDIFGFTSIPMKVPNRYIFMYVLLSSPDGECKFWLEPIIILASNRGIPSHELREVERLVYKNQDLLRSAYHDFHNR